MRGTGVLWGRAPGFCGEGCRVLWELGSARRMETEGLLAACANASNAAGAPAAPFARQSRSPTSCLKPYERSRPPTSRPKRRGLRALLGGAGVLWELGFARRMETEGLLAACANASNTAGAPAATFARQSRSPTSCLKPYERSRSPTSRLKRRGLRALLGGAGVLWELGFARRMETEGLLAACANASNTAGAPAAPFARQSRPPTILTSQFSCGWFCPGSIGKPRGQHP